MTTDAESRYDPDAPPASSYGDFIGVLKASVMIAPNTLATQPQHVQDSITQYWEKGRKAPVWYLEAHGLSHQRTDGQPYRQTDIISLQDKNGKWLGKKQTPDLLAAQYRGLGVTASFAANPITAIERAFHFVEYVKDEGKRWAKSITLYPTKIFAVGYAYDGELTMVTPKSDDSGSVNGASPSAVPAVSEEQAISFIRTAFAGKSPQDMFDVIMASPELKGVGKLFGVSLMEAATDESLAAVLTENKVLTLNAEGKFEVPA